MAVASCAVRRHPATEAVLLGVDTSEGSGATLTVQLLQLRNLRLSGVLTAGRLTLARLLTVAHTVAALSNHLARLVLHSRVSGTGLARERWLMLLVDGERGRVLLTNIARGGTALMATVALELGALTGLRLAVRVALRSDAGSLRLASTGQVQGRLGLSGALLLLS